MAKEEAWEEGRRETQVSGQKLTVHHGLATPLSLVGLQVWRGALLLGDYILHNRRVFTGSTVLELGAGPGVAGLLAARFAEEVILTDADRRTLDNCQANVNCNSGSARVRVRRLDWTQPPDWLAAGNAGEQPTTGPPCLPPGKVGLAARAAAAVGALPQEGQQGAHGLQKGGAISPKPAAQPQELLLNPWRVGSSTAPPVQQPPPAGQGCFEWQAADLAVLPRLGYILAADCIYDNDLTEALMRTAVQLMRLPRRQNKRQQPGEGAGAVGGAGYGRCPAAGSSSALAPSGTVLLVALEKRIAFTLHDMDVRAPAYDFWRTLFVEVGGAGKAPLHEKADAGEGAGSSDCVAPPASSRGLHLSCGGAAPPAASAGLAREERRWLRQRLRDAPFPLLGRRVDVSSIPQQIEEYERGQYLELWKLWLADLD
ncbi:hypothetical protein N2152v2_004848 [Parachlorella kessleri]